MRIPLISAVNLLTGDETLADHERAVISIDGSELVRVVGARCMTCLAPRRSLSGLQALPPRRSRDLRVSAERPRGAWRSCATCSASRKPTPYRRSHRGGAARADRRFGRTTDGR